MPRNDLAATYFTKRRMSGCFGASVCKRYEEGSVMPVTTQAREISGHPNLAPEKLGHKDLVARAAALIPQLRERVAEAEQTRKLPALNVEAVRNAGLFRV